MLDQAFLPYLAAGFGVGFLHALLPTHWLPFALTSHARRWSLLLTLEVTTFAAGAHVLSTALLGVIAAVLGAGLKAFIGVWFSKIAGVVLIGFGLTTAAATLAGRHAHGHLHLRRTPRSDLGAAIGLFLFLLVSPCEVYAPIYLAAARFGVSGFVLLTAALGLATVSAMALFTILARHGLQRLKLERLERLEGLAIALVLAMLGVAVLVFGDRLG